MIIFFKKLIFIFIQEDLTNIKNEVKVNFENK